MYDDLTRFQLSRNYILTTVPALDEQNDRKTPQKNYQKHLFFTVIRQSGAFILLLKKTQNLSL